MCRDHAGHSEARAADINDSHLAVIARSIYNARRRRLAHFDGRFFGEPSWDILLDLFVRTTLGERVTTTSLCVAAEVPQSTSRRWIAALEEEDLIRRYAAPDDGRVLLVRMSKLGYDLMRRYVIEGIARYEMPRAGRQSICPSWMHDL